MTQVWALWDGGVNYSAGSIYDGDTEVFPSINAAADALFDRARRGAYFRQSFVYADGRTETTFTPNADSDCRMSVYLYNPSADDVTDPYPDRIITIGPRGGCRIERV